MLDPWQQGLRGPWRVVKRTLRETYTYIACRRGSLRTQLWKTHVVLIRYRSLWENYAVLHRMCARAQKQRMEGGPLFIFLCARTKTLAPERGRIQRFLQNTPVRGVSSVKDLRALTKNRGLLRPCHPLTNSPLLVYVDTCDNLSSTELSSPPPPRKYILIPP